MADITPPNGKTSKIEALQSRLDSPSQNFGIRKRKILKQKEYSTQTNWDDGGLGEKLDNYTQGEKKLNVFMIFFVLAAIFFVGAAGYGLLTFLGGNQNISGNDVDISIIGPVAIGGGEELTLDIIVQNNNQTQLETVDLVIEYPNGTKKSDDLKTDLPRVREGLGILNPNSVVKTTHSATLFGEEGVEKQIVVLVEYRIPGSNAIFQKRKEFDVILQSSPIRLTVDTVKEITPNQELVFKVGISSNGTQTLENIMIVADYPFGFTLENSNFETFDDDNVWLFKELKPQEDIILEIVGRLEGQNKEERVFKFNAGIADQDIPNELGVVFTTLPKAVTISKPFLELQLSIDGDMNANVVREGGKQIQGRILYKNNTETNIQIGKIIITVDGEVLEESSMFVSDGFYRSQDNTIIWDQNSVSDLSEIITGNSGALNFSFRTKTLANSSGVFKNPEITLSAIVTGRRISEDPVPEEIVSTTFKRIQFISDIAMTGQAMYSTGPFTDTGPIPPKANTDTTYTVNLTLSNSSNEVQKGRATTILPNYVKWNNKTSGDGNIIYDPVSRTVEWDVGTIAPHVGFTTAKKSAFFQVTVTPSITQLGNSPALIGDVTFTGYDIFTQRNVEEKLTPVSINLIGRAFGDNRVVE